MKEGVESAADAVWLGFIGEQHYFNILRASPEEDDRRARLGLLRVDCALCTPSFTCALHSRRSESGAVGDACVRAGAGAGSASREERGAADTGHADSGAKRRLWVKQHAPVFGLGSFDVERRPEAEALPGPIHEARPKAVPAAARPMAKPRRRSLQTQFGADMAVERTAWIDRAASVGTAASAAIRL